MYYQNVRGLRTKTKYFNFSSTGCFFDIITLTETGLNSTVDDGELFDSNDFCVYRCDRSEDNSVHKRLGGVLVAVKTSIPSEKIIVPQTENVELVVVKVRFGKTSVYVCSLNIPSKSPISVYQQYTVALERVIDHIDIGVEDRLYVLGDFNMSNVHWLPQSDGVDFSSNCFLDESFHESNSLLPFNIDNGTNADLLYCLLGAGLSQTNGNLNYQGKILDLVFCSNPGDVTVSKSDSLMVKIDPYHDPVEIQFTVDTDDVVEFNHDEHEFNFRKANFDDLNAYLTSVNWEFELSSGVEVDAVVDHFYDLLLIGFSQYVLFKKKGLSSHPPWYSKTLLALKNRKVEAQRRYSDCKKSGKSADCTECYIRFCSLRNQFNTAQLRAYDSYLETTQANLISDPSKFWSYVNVM